VCQVKRVDACVHLASLNQTSAATKDPLRCVLAAAAAAAAAAALLLLLRA